MSISKGRQPPGGTPRQPFVFGVGPDGSRLLPLRRGAHNFIYLFRQKPAALALSVTVVNALICLDAVLANGAGEMRSYIQLAAIAAVPLMLLYNGRRGPRLKYLFYAYYPAHLLVLTFLAGRF